MTEMRCRLTRLHTDDSDHALRDEVVEGDCPVEPRLRNPFTMFATGRDVPGALRVVTTSPIETITVVYDPEEVALVFRTRSGTLYRWERLDG